MDVIIVPILELLRTIAHLYTWVLIASVILSWLVSFHIINTHNRFIAVFGELLHKLTEPVLAPIRRLLPSMAGIDLSPIIAIFASAFIQNVISRLIFRIIGLS